MEITLVNCQIQIANNPNGQRVLIFIDSQSGIKVVVPLNAETARAISQGLSGSKIIVPSLIPPRDVIRGNGGA